MHSSHEPRPEEGPYLPAEQLIQETAPNALYLPFGQEVHFVAPAEEDLPAAQFWQVLELLAPAVFEDLPAGQLLQPVLAPFSYLPAGQV